MKSLGAILTTLGFLFVAWVTVQDPLEVNWLLFGVALAVCIAGIIIMRSNSTKEATDAETLSGSLTSVRASLDTLVKNIVDLDATKGSMSPYDFHGYIDKTFPEDLNVFVESRKAIGHVYGLNAYADVMNSFAAGERYLNRVWSCSVDGYIDEVHEYVTRCKEQFIEAKEKLAQLGDAA